MGAEEERAMTTTIVLAKAMDMATEERARATAKRNGRLKMMVTATATKMAY
jgi:hypothetical protein